MHSRSLHMSIPVKFAIFLAFLFLIITYVSVEIKYNKLVEEKQLIQDKITTVEESIEALQNKLDSPFDEEYIIALAREKLNYCLPDEIIFYNDSIN